MTKEVDKLEHTLHYSFADKSLILTALTHRSFGKSNNERLEFLGDAILGYLVAQWLFQRFTAANTCLYLREAFNTTLNIKNLVVSFSFHLDN